MDVLSSSLAALANEILTLANMLSEPSLERDREFLLSFVGGFFILLRVIVTSILHCFQNDTTEI